MPTNKLWIEHTERAAWESVTALRAELADGKKRLLISEARLRDAQEELARQHSPMPDASAVSLAIPPSARLVAPASGDAEYFETVARRFVGAMQRRYRALVQSEAPLSLEQVLSALDDEIGGLGEMDEIELADAAVDLAVFALCLHREARRAGGT
jgi:hypothetical protein